MVKIKITKKDGERIGIFGASGCGKTTKARELTKNISRLIIFDSIKNEWVENGNKWLGKKIIVVDTFKKFVETMKKVFFQKEFCIVFKPSFGKETQQLDNLCQMIFNYQKDYGKYHNSMLTLFIEEAQESIPSGLNRNNNQHGALLIARMGRAKGINLIVASQRIKTVDITIRANLSAMYLFRLAELSDIQEANNYVNNKEKLLNQDNFTYFYIYGKIKKFCKLS